MIIYKTINLISGKIYIGQDSNNNPDYIGSGNLIKLAIKKYGKENFKKTIIEECFSKEQLNEREKFWIEKLNSRDKTIGYNISSGGDGGDTISQHPNKKEIIKRISSKNIGKKRSSEFCDRLRDIHIGIKRSAETIRKTKENHADFSGKNNPSWGLKRNKETIQKLKDAWVKRKQKKSGVYHE